MTGDWAAVRKIPDMDRAVIKAILPRKTCFYRENAGLKPGEQAVSANIDYLFIVMSLDLDFNLNRLERYLVLGWNSGANPVIVLSKSDQCGDIEIKKVTVESAAPGIPVVTVSAFTGGGLEELFPYLKPGKTIALAGSSGVGKSTIINSLIGAEVQTTLPVRGNDCRGRHATTGRELFILPNGAIIIDNPGMREIGLTGNDSILTRTFKDIYIIAGSCRFRDCSHREEPGCAVREALKNEELSSTHYNNFLKLLKEVRYQESRTDAELRREIKEKWKNISKYAKSIKKNYLQEK